MLASFRLKHPHFKYLGVPQALKFISLVLNLIGDVPVSANEVLVAVGVDDPLGEVSGLEVATHVDATGQLVAGLVVLKPATHPAQAGLVQKARTVNRPGPLSDSISRTIRSVAKGTRLSGSMKSGVVYVFLPSHRIESDRGAGPFVNQFVPFFFF